MIERRLRILLTICATFVVVTVSGILFFSGNPSSPFYTPRIEMVMHPYDYFILGVDVSLVRALTTLNVGMTDTEVFQIIGKEPDDIMRNAKLHLWFGEKAEVGTTVCNPNKAFYYNCGFDRACYVIFDASDTVQRVVIGGT